MESVNLTFVCKYTCLCHARFRSLECSGGYNKPY